MSTRIVLTLTTSKTKGTHSMSGPHEISIQGTFDGATVTHYTFDREKGRGAVARTATTVADVYLSNTTHSEFEITGGSGSEDINIIAKSINSLGRG